MAREARAAGPGRTRCGSGARERIQTLTSSEADDRVLPATRVAAAIVAVVLTAAGVILYAFPAETARLWAWEMNPRTTSMAVGAGYLAGATFFVRAWREERWHVIGLAFVAAWVLTTLLLLATILHWANFSHGHVSFWTWLVVYAITPVLLPWLWWRNQRHDPRDAVVSATVPQPLRWGVGGLGVVQVAAALALFARPALAIDRWPWALSPLTTRTITAFLAFIGVVWAAFLWEGRWSALRLHVQSATLGLALVGIGILRGIDDLTGSAAAVGIVAGLLTATIVGAVALQLFMDAARA
jgi:hypothetical protein